MKIVFVSNHLNLHVSPLCDSLASLPGVSFSFIASALENKGSERKETKTDVISSPYLLNSRTSKANFLEAKKIIKDADVLIFGSEDPRLFDRGIRNQLTFRYSERFLKKRDFPFLRKKKAEWRCRNESSDLHYLLCAGDFAFRDYSECGLYRNRCLRWGYFPEGNQKRDLSGKRLFSLPEVQLFWSGRMVNWKRPFFVLQAAQILSSMNIPFHINVAGDGPELPKLRKEVEAHLWNGHFSFLGMVPNSENLSLMANTDIFLFTSDRQEGWGAVLNEALSSKCLVIASSDAGATSFLIHDGENGYCFRGDDSFRRALKLAVLQKGKSCILAEKGRETIVNVWNADFAVNRLLTFAANIQERKESSAVFCYTDGPVSLLG